ncbi:Carboxylesterase [Eremomyces bilateralis CBS 781.70]|uniref:Carboxylic ester hydrolase n=1 Tax=Eremomyces bilateralis CBS 781.70 TaxID=1392243 RepID=A0A6G1G126_9PEZI|nr:Carboxylesterase [Eremomyces bilateralis CBS 781.70]KAF1811630.1 Carboxylesterase [Eremomyces bilateralis CBS 781.70]
MAFKDTFTHVAVSFLFAIGAVSCQSPTVTISSGPVIGTQTSVPNFAGTVNKFLGIPFAAPPQRFSPPQNPASWTSPLSATALKPACIQQFNYPEDTRNFTIKVFSTPMPEESEDCLYVNVYAPSTAAPRGGRPVMFWIYGGNLQFGTGSLPIYDGSNLAAVQDVIVVTHNYRTNVFGFPNAPGIPPTEQNLAFLDQRKALDWTYKNIAKFGGDPTKITIFGESAGGYSVKQLYVNPPNPLPFRAAIMQSQAASFAAGSSGWDGLASALNCTGTAALECVRAAPASKVKDIVERQALSFGPVVDNVTASNTVAAELKAGDTAKVPILIGTNAQEGSAFAISLGLNFPGAFEAFLTTIPIPEIQEALRTFYAPLDTDILKVGQAITDLTFHCPASQVASIPASINTPVWRYFFNSTFANDTPFEGSGAYHSSEIPYIFGTYKRDGSVPQQELLSLLMQTSWASFAKNPTLGPGSGWPKLTPSGNGTQVWHFGSREPAYIPASTLDAVCPILAPIIALSGI